MHHIFDVLSYSSFQQQSHWNAYFKKSVFIIQTPSRFDVLKCMRQSYTMSQNEKLRVTQHIECFWWEISTILRSALFHLVIIDFLFFSWHFFPYFDFVLDVPVENELHLSNIWVYSKYLDLPFVEKKRRQFVYLVALLSYVQASGWRAANQAPNGRTDNQIVVLCLSRLSVL